MRVLPIYIDNYFVINLVISMEKSIGLQLTNRSKPGKEAFDTRPRAVQEWIESLPRASVGRCAQLIYAMLHETNKLDIRFQDRIAMLEALREAVQYVALGMQKHYTSTAFPLPDKSLKIASATREIYAKMATGYQIAIEDLLSNSMLMLDKTKLTTYLHRSISYLSQVLLTTYQVYAPLPNGIWLKLNKLYAFAEENKLHWTQITDNQHQNIKKTTISGEYIRILLLSLASPYHLRRGEVAKVYINLERWMHMPTLNKNNAGESIIGDFSIDLSKDKPPGYLAISGDEIFNINVRTLETFALAESLFGELQQSEEIKSKTLLNINLPQAQLSHNLIRRLGRTWGAIPKRAHDRQEIHENIQAAFGMSAIHNTLMIMTHNKSTDSAQAKDNKLLKAIATKSHYAEKKVEHIHDVKADVWNMVYDNSHLRLVSNNTSPKVANTPEPGPTAQTCLSNNWRLLNMSDGGFCIQCTGDCGANVQVGELVAYLPATQPAVKRHTIGVIRWMRSDGKNGMTLGGQILGQEPIAVGISIAATGIENNPVQRAILLPAYKTLGRPSALITLATPFRAGAIVKLHMESGEITVKLNDEREGAGLYDEFEYQQLNNPGHNAQTDKNSAKSNDTDFNDIWSSI